LHEVRGRSVLECQTVRDGADGSLLRVQYWRFGVVFWTVRRSSRTVRGTHADGPLGGPGRSA
jgi:hypothetical protein